MALILLPFLVNSFWIYLLMGSLDRTAKLVDLEQQGSESLEHLFKATQLMAGATGHVFSYLMKQKEIYRYRAEDKITALENELRHIPDNSSKDKELVASMKEQVVQIRSVLSTSSASGEDLVMSTGKRQSLRSLLAASFSRGEELLQLCDQREQELDEMRETSASARKNVNLLVVCGLIVNLGLALMAAAFFIKNISQRLNILLENARRLPKRQELAKLVGGQDELSYLDEAMHNAASDLQAAFEFRASLMQMVAHDLRSPLQASEISLTILYDHESANATPTALRHIERVKANNQRIIALVNDLLTLDSLESGQLELQKEETTAKEVAQEAIDTLSQLAAVKKIELQNLATETDIFVDKRKISQVLINYITNAIKFSPPDSVIKIGCDSENDRVRIFVRDQGAGLTLEETERVFEKFFQAKEGKSAGGFGLGLAICRLIVESHGGDVGVFSEKGDGAEFWFRIKAKSKS